jgi:inner membrane protein
MLPDADVVGFRLGIDYGDVLGHRGASHSLFVAAIVAALVTALLRQARWRLAFLFLFISMASHGLLDAITNGGLGPALFWPADDARYFAPVRPVRVSPIGAGFFSARGIGVLLSEFLWLWLPTLGLAALIWLSVRVRKQK